MAKMGPGAKAARRAEPEAYWTKGETKRRLKALARTAKAMNPEVPGNATVEVGGRTITVWLTEPPTKPSDLFAEGEDLTAYEDIDSAAAFTRKGEVVHLYFGESKDRGENYAGDLVDIAVCWMGTDEHLPMVCFGKDWQTVDHRKQPKSK